jgi:hypothetical protein
MSSRRSALRLLLWSPLLVLMPALAASRLAHAADAGALDAGAVEIVLSRQGFRDVVDVRRKGAIWVARASGPDGRRMLAVVDAASGEITGLKPVDGPPIPPRASVVRF